MIHRLGLTGLGLGRLKKFHGGGYGSLGRLVRCLGNTTGQLLLDLVRVRVQEPIMRSELGQDKGEQT